MVQVKTWNMAVFMCNSDLKLLRKYTTVIFFIRMDTNELLFFLKVFLDSVQFYPCLFCVIRRKVRTFFCDGIGSCDFFCDFNPLVVSLRSLLCNYSELWISSQLIRFCKK